MESLAGQELTSVGEEELLEALDDLLLAVKLHLSHRNSLTLKNLEMVLDWTGSTRDDFIGQKAGRHATVSMQTKGNREQYEQTSTH